MQRRRLGEALGEKVACRRDSSQFSCVLLARRSVGETEPSAPGGPPNIGVKSVNRATRKSRDRVIAEDSILTGCGVSLGMTTHKHHTTLARLLPVR